jgi:hypothetical protein
MHQSTVCRSLQLMQSQFHLEPRQGSAVCRHGHNPCLHYLRLAYREHRLMEGLLRIGTDVLHQCLLRDLAGVQQVPPHFRNAEHWAELVRHGLLDGAIVSSFCMEERLLSGQAPRLEGLVALSLGQVSLQLVSPAATARRVLVPRKVAVPLLHQTLLRQGNTVEQQPAACREPEASVKRCKDRLLVLPVCPALLPQAWLECHGLQLLAQQPVLVEHLWLLLPQGVSNSAVARSTVTGLRQALSQAETMRDLHGPPVVKRERAQQIGCISVTTSRSLKNLPGSWGALACLIHVGM